MNIGMMRIDWQCDGKGGPGADLAYDPDSSLMKLYQFFYNCQSQTGTAVFLALLVPDFIEAVPNMIQIMGRYTDPVVAHMDDKLFSGLIRLYQNLTVFRKLIGIIQQIDENLLQTMGIC
jgi:hypothetical protein